MLSTTKASGLVKSRCNPVITIHPRRLGRYVVKSLLRRVEGQGGTGGEGFGSYEGGLRERYYAVLVDIALCYRKTWEPSISE